MIVLFLEYIPHTLYNYLAKNENYAEKFYTQSIKIVKFLNNNNILHNDSHIGNYLVDDKGILYLTDFGLSLDKDFDLNIHEKKFMRLNKKLDLFYTHDDLFSIYFNKVYYNKKLYNKYKLGDINTLEISNFILDNLDQLNKEIDNPLSKFHVYFLQKNKVNIIKYVEWFRNLRKSKNKETYFVNKLKI